MTFWEFCDRHPFIALLGFICAFGFFLAIIVLLCVGVRFER